MGGQGDKRSTRVTIYQAGENWRIPNISPTHSTKTDRDAVPFFLGSWNSKVNLVCLFCLGR